MLLGRKIRSRGKLRIQQKICDQYRFAEDVCPQKRKKKAKRGSLSVEDKVNIVHQVLVQNEMYADVAKEHRVSQQVIRRIIKQARDNKKFLAELMSERNAKQLLEKEVR